MNTGRDCRGQSEENKRGKVCRKIVTVKIKRRIVSILLLAAALFLLAGCSANRQGGEPQEKEEQKKLQIGMSFDSFVIERWLRDRDLFVLTAKDLGADVNVQVANGDAREQASQIRYFIQKGMDVIVIIAVDGEKLSDVVSEARSRGIRVISYDRLIMNAGTDLYISFDNEKVGTLMGEAMADALPDGGNIFAIYGSPTDHNVSMVQEGFEKVVSESSLKIVYSNYCENWLAELAFDAVEEGLSKTPRNLVGVMCGNDDLASQAFRALAENRLAGKVVLVGQDAELSACQRIVEGTQTMTVYKPVETLAAKAAEFACAIGYEKLLEEGRIAEKDIPASLTFTKKTMETLDTINDGTSEVPYYGIDPVAVTKENLDRVIIDSDFHTREDVYLNVR